MSIVSSSSRLNLLHSYRIVKLKHALFVHCKCAFGVIKGVVCLEMSVYSYKLALHFIWLKMQFNLVVFQGWCIKTLVIKQDVKILVWSQ